MQNCLGLSILQEAWISSEIWCIVLSAKSQTSKVLAGLLVCICVAGGQEMCTETKPLPLPACAGHKERGRGRKRSGREKPGAGSRGAGEIG